MQLTVFGATGGTGSHVVTQALAAGHHVRAVVRTPGKLRVDHENLTVHQADVLDPDALVPVLTGSSAVISALGPSSRTDTTRICTRGIRSILTAMTRADVDRIVVTSAQPVLRSGEGEPFWFRHTVTRLVQVIFRNTYADLAEMERVLAASPTQWTVLRPPYLTDAPGTGGYRTAYEANITGSSLSRVDLATALLDVVPAAETHRHALGVTAARRSTPTTRHDFLGDAGGSRR